MIDRTVSHYRILEKLGEGGMGVVYKAEDTRLHRVVALKFLGSRAVDNELDRRRLIREAQTAAALDHPNICTVYEIDEVDEGTFIAMAYLEGSPLSKHIGTSPLPVEEALKVAIQLAEGLNAAHDLGIIHRDIKSNNVMISERGGVRIMDFGLAIRNVEGETAELESIGGTPAYMSPEHLRREPTDVRADIWSWGVVFYEMLTARLPFRSDSPASMVRAILGEDPPPIAAINPLVPPEVERIIRKALAKRPEDRYGSMSEVLVELRSPPRTSDESRPAAPPSIAVLAFDDLSPNKDQDYFCEGIAEEIINDLTRLEGVRVAARTSAFAYRGTTLDIREIGRKLGVATVLEGSVRKAGDRLRITAQLVSVTDGYHLWSERFDRRLSDVFAIQEEIARSIVRALRLSLTRGEGWESARPATRDIEAYDFYLRGRQFFYRAKRQALEFALRMFGQATERDPGYALAYAGMADSYSYLCMYHGGQDADLEWADRASRKALELAPNLAEAHAARGLAVSLRGRYDEAEREFEEAMRIDPDLFEAYYFYGRTCVAQGKLEDAARLFEKAGDVRPEDYQAQSLLGFTFVGLDRPRHAELAYVRSFKRTERYLQLNPDDSRATYLGGQSLIRLGEEDRGIEWVERAIALDPEDPYIIYGAACAYCLVNRLDEAVRLLERAVRAGFAHVKWIEHDHDFEAIRDDPRFDAILQEARKLHRPEKAY